MSNERKPQVCSIMVVGVGGGGGNAINRMKQYDLGDVRFVAINTDLQDLYDSDADVCIQIGSKITKGQGAGAKPEIGMRAAEESREAIDKVIGDADLVFITAGMGGGTGTGAAPIVASIAKEKGILTVGVVTKPFEFEGHIRMANALMGIENLKKCVDTLIVIQNDKLKDILPQDVKVEDSFRYADEVLRQGIKGITDLIKHNALINLDFADVNNVLRGKGLAHMGVGEGSGENRTVDAIKRAVSSPLLDTTIENATSAILNFEGGDDLGLTEIYRAAELFKQILADNANIIFGLRINPELKGRAIATVIATGFDMPAGKAGDTRTQKQGPPADGFKPFGSYKPPKGGDAPGSGANGSAKGPVPPNAAFYSESRGFNSYVDRQKKDENDNIQSTRIDADIETLPKWLKDKLDRE